MRKLKPVIPAALVGIMTLSTLAMPFAATTLIQSSTGSVAEDFGSTAPAAPADDAVGQDKQQSKYSEFETKTQADGDIADHTVNVYASVASTYTVKIPKTIILGNSEGVTKGAYKVEAFGDIAGNEKITVAPPTNFPMVSGQGKADVQANITQEKTVWIDDLAKAALADVDTNTKLNADGTTPVALSGSIETATPLTAGTWSGTFNFNISLTAE